MLWRAPTFSLLLFTSQPRRDWILFLPSHEFKLPKRPLKVIFHQEFCFAYKLHSGEKNAKSWLPFWSEGRKIQSIKHKYCSFFFIYLFFRAGKAKHNLIFQKITCHTSFSWLKTMPLQMHLCFTTVSDICFISSQPTVSSCSHFGNFLKISIILEELAKEKLEWLLAVSVALK